MSRKGSSSPICCPNDCSATPPSSLVWEIVPCVRGRHPKSEFSAIQIGQGSASLHEPLFVVHNFIVKDDCGDRQRCVGHKLVLANSGTRSLRPVDRSAVPRVIGRPWPQKLSTKSHKSSQTAPRRGREQAGEPHKNNRDQCELCPTRRTQCIAMRDRGPHACDRVDRHQRHTDAERQGERTDPCYGERPDDGGNHRHRPRPIPPRPAAP